MSECLLSIGSNIEPEKHIPQCIEVLKTQLTLLKISSVHETIPVGMNSQRLFWNLAVLAKTPLSREKLSSLLRQVENNLGRIRDPHHKFAPRTIDIDLLPTPGYEKQPFVIIPLAEICPDKKDPESGLTFLESAETIDQKTILRKFPLEKSGS